MVAEAGVVLDTVRFCAAGAGVNVVPDALTGSAATV
jgi:hypothetical protein